MLDDNSDDQSGLKNAMHLTEAPKKLEQVQSVPEELENDQMEDEESEKEDSDHQMIQ